MNRPDRPGSAIVGTSVAAIVAQPLGIRSRTPVARSRFLGVSAMTAAPPPPVSHRSAMPSAAGDAGPMDWARLLSAARFRGDGVAASDPGLSDPRSAFQKDADRVIYCAPFRRLQDKTQVHSLPASDFIRTRLTHSLEVSAVGRSLGVVAGRQIIERHRLRDRMPTVGKNDFGEIVSAACLAHDIGNPPFGHAGEDAIRHWFAHTGRPYLQIDGLSPRQRADLAGFEGNAQGFRILTRLTGWRERGGLQLTTATLGATIKYPFGSLGPHGETRRKFGITQRDDRAFQAVAADLGLPPHADAPDGFTRHPLNFLVEAADDICYLVVDLEDAFKMRRVDYATTKDLLEPVAGADLDRYGEVEPGDDTIAYLRAKAIGNLINQTVEAFLDLEPEILAGRYDGHLLQSVDAARALARIRGWAESTLYIDRDKAIGELAGTEVIEGLLSLFARAAHALEQVGGAVDRLDGVHQRILRLLPQPAIMATDRYEWLLRITDYVSGMTDRYALALYGQLRGLGART